MTGTIVYSFAVLVVGLFRMFGIVRAVTSLQAIVQSRWEAVLALIKCIAMVGFIIVARCSLRWFLRTFGTVKAFTACQPSCSRS